MHKHFPSVKKKYKIDLEKDTDVRNLGKYLHMQECMYKNADYLLELYS